MKTFVLLCVLGVLFESCDRKMDLTKSILQMQSQQVFIPFKYMWQVENDLDTLRSSIQPNLKLVVYSDSTSCSLCALKRIYKWSDMLRKIRMYGGKLNVSFVLEPLTQERNSCYLIAKGEHLMASVYIDTLGLFAKENPHIPSNPEMYTFLLDENNNVILVGSPLENKKIEELFWQIVEEKLGKRE